MTPKLSTELETAVLDNRGLLRVEGEHHAFVVMTVQAYREMSGVGTDDELADSLRAIQEGLADVAAGRVRPFRDVLAELGRADDIPS